MVLTGRKLTLTEKDIELIFDEWVREFNNELPEGLKTSFDSKISTDFFIKLHDKIFTEREKIMRNKITMLGDKLVADVDHLTLNINKGDDVVCGAMACANNLVNHSCGDFECNLKRIEIDENGKCSSFHIINKEVET